MAAAYFTHHLPVSIANTRHFNVTHFDGRKTTVIPPLVPNPSSNPNAVSAAGSAPSTEPGSEHRSFDSDTLAHFLHTFHTRYGFPDGQGPLEPQGPAHPNFDLVESKTGYTIYGALAGLRREDVTVETDDLLSTVTVTGVVPRGHPEPVPTRAPTPELEPEEENEDGGEEGEEGRKYMNRERRIAGTRDCRNRTEEDYSTLHWHVVERRAGSFCRVFHLPLGLEDMVRVRASMRDGLLTVTVPKTVAEIYREEVSRRRTVKVSGGNGEEGK